MFENLAYGGSFNLECFGIPKKFALRALLSLVTRQGRRGGGAGGLRFHRPRMDLPLHHRVIFVF